MSSIESKKIFSEGRSRPQMGSIQTPKVELEADRLVILDMKRAFPFNL